MYQPCTIGAARLLNMNKLLEKIWMHRGYPRYKYVVWGAKDNWRNVKRKTEAAVVKMQGGYKCVDCGATGIRFKNAHYEGDVNGKRMLLEYTGGHRHPIGKTLCPHCLADRITAYWADKPPLKPSVFGDPDYGWTEDHGPYLSNTSGGVFYDKCYWFDEERLVVEGIRNWSNPSCEKFFDTSMVIIGGGYWNGHNASLEAITTLLRKTGVAKTSFLVNSKMSVEGMSAQGLHIRMHSTQYSDGCVQGDPQPVTEIIQKVQTND